MSPSKLARRSGYFFTGIASGTFLLAMAASPAYAGIGGINVPPVALPTSLGSICTTATTLPATLKCVNGLVTQVTSTLPAVPTTAPTTTAPGATVSPSPNPLSGITDPLTGTVNKLGQTVNGVTGSLGGATGGKLPTTPTTPANPVTGSTGAKAGKGGSTSGSKGGSTSTTTAKKPASDGSSLLGPAAAFLPGSAVASFADLSSGGLVPLADNIPSPLLAAPETKLAAVQAPLIAAGERASDKANSVLARFAGKALPGILVVLATAMVAAVGAGNLRAWQARTAAKRAKATA